LRTGVFVCACGPNIADKIDIERVANEASKIDGVVISETYGLLCSPDGKKYLSGKITENNLDRIVIAACSPREHETTFMKVCETAGLNPFMMQMANIREQVAWVTRDGMAATEKALRLVRGAISRISRHEQLEKTSIVCNPDILVIGGGAVGMSTSLLLAEADRRITIIEREPSSNGSITTETEKVIEKLTAEVSEQRRIRLIRGHELEKLVGFFGNFIADLGKDEIRAGAVVLATGCSWNDRDEAISADGFGNLAEMLRITTDQYGFPVKEHSSLAPVSTTINGVYVAGCAGGPCSLADAISQSEAVAGTILSTLIPEREVETEPRTSRISKTLCRGCKTCLEVCGYGAISFAEDKLICTVNNVLCKGCGNCAAACPSGAIRALHYTPDQIRFQMAGVLR